MMRLATAAVRPARFELATDEVAAVRSAVGEVTRRIESSDDPELYRLAALATGTLPRRLVGFLHAFRGEEATGGCLVTGWPVDDATIGPTPPHWRRAQPAGPAAGSAAGSAGEPALAHEVYLVLLASVLGEVYSWSTVQDGRLVQDLLPVPGQELEKNANSSASVLDLHSEDAFSDLRCDYLALLCLRNDDRVPTAYASIADVDLSPEHRRVLAEPRYLLLPDPDHLRRAAERGLEPPAPARTALLFGDPDTPYVVVDEYFIETDPGDSAAREALAALVAGLLAAQQDIALLPGEALFLDNYRAVHGRAPFTARYDGRDRWLKRLSVTRDLRKSRAMRRSARSRVIEHR